MSNSSLLGSYGDSVGFSMLFRNRLINGNMRVTQRGSIPAVNNTVVYGGADRWFCLPASFTTVTAGSIVRSALTGTTSGYGQWLAGFSTTGAGTVTFGQRIELLNTADLNSKSLAFSGVLYQDTGSTLTVEIKLLKAGAADNFTTSTQIGSTATFSIPSGVSTRVIASYLANSTDGNNGIAVDIKFLGVGAVTSKNFAIGDCQLEAGPVATPLETRPIGMELALCQRYYYRYTTTNTYPFIDTVAATGTFPIANMFYPVTLRTTPTSSATIGSAGLNNCSSLTLSTPNPFNAYMQVTSTASSGRLYAQWTPGQGFEVSAEL